MASVDLLFSLAGGVSRIATPLEDSLASEQAFSSYLRTFGWNVAPSQFSIADVRAALPTATAMVAANGIMAEIQASNDFPPFTRYLELADAFHGVVAGLENLSGSAAPAGIPAEAWATFSSELLDNLIASDLRATAPGILAPLLFAGIVTEDEVDLSGTPGRVSYTRKAISWNQLGTLFTDPAALVREVYDWDRPGATFRFDILLARLGRLFPLLGLPAATAIPSAALLDDYYSASNPVRSEVRELKLMLIQGADEGGSLEASLYFLPIPESGDVNGPPRGLAVGPRLVVTGQPPAALFWPYGLTLLGEGGRAKYEGARVELLPSGHKVRLPASSDVTLDASARLERLDQSPTVVVGSIFSHRLEFHGTGLTFAVRGPITNPEVELGVDIVDARIVIDLSDGDGLLTEVMGNDIQVVEFDLGLVWSSRSGFHLRGSGAIDITLPLHLSFAGFTLIALHVRAEALDGPVRVTAGVSASFELGPIVASVDNIGSKIDLVPVPAGQPAGTFGRLDLDFGFKPPNGIGIAIDAGAVKGGGFLYLDFDAGRYSGVFALTVFGINVKAFGVVDTKFPDGSKGFSFVVIISAEFTPIQLGFGFTLVGVGGLLGVNRSLDQRALADAVRTGSLAHVLFPRDPVRDAPTILHELSALFPAAKAHFVLGPMAKLGWGTPTLITADLGIVLELPGPRIAVLGVVRMQLPSPELVILSLQLAVAGLLDFPARLFSLDASLFDSYVAGYAVSGDMAFRLGFGNKAAFLLSVGGFNSGFAPPPKFPELRRVSVDLGVNGNPSLTASGYFALTSNTAQIGAKIELRASGYGIRLNGWLGFDVLFVFSPFSFTASISAGMRVSFHGVGIGVTLHGSLSGPTPWHVKGRVCVSVLWWDACLPVDVTFGRSQPAALPELDPWVGSGETDDARVKVLGLREAVSDARNWSGSTPPAGFSVVTLADAATQERTPIDPLGSATLRQKVAPLNRVLEKFGEFKPKVHDHFDVTSVTLNEVDLNADGIPDQVPFEVVTDDFAPAHFTELSSAQKLSSDSYEPMDAGVSIAPNVVRSGAAGSQVLEYETAFITGTGETIRDLPSDARFKLSHEQLLVMLERSASALGGIRRTGAQRYNLPLDREKKVTLAPRTFVVADACSLTPNSTITPTGTSRSKALLALRAHLRSNPGDQARFTLVPARAA